MLRTFLQFVESVDEGLLSRFGDAAKAGASAFGQAWSASQPSPQPASPEQPEPPRHDAAPTVARSELPPFLATLNELWRKAKASGFNTRDVERLFVDMFKHRQEIESYYGTTLVQSPTTERLLAVLRKSGFKVVPEEYFKAKAPTAWQSIFPWTYQAQSRNGMTTGRLHCIFPSVYDKSGNVVCSGIYTFE